MRVHQDFTRNVLRGAKPHVVKDVRAMLGQEISLEEFKYWTALVRMHTIGKMELNLQDMHHPWLSGLYAGLQNAS